MSICRVWYWPDKKISISYPDLRAGALPPGEQFEQVRLKGFKTDPITELPLPYEDLPFEDVDTSQLPNAGDRGNSRNKWRGSKGNGVKLDPLA